MSNTPGYSRAYTKKGKREIRKQFKSQLVGQNQRVKHPVLGGSSLFGLGAFSVAEVCLLGLVTPTMSLESCSYNQKLPVGWVQPLQVQNTQERG